jgi:hypothetical protein
MIYVLEFSDCHVMRARHGLPWLHTWFVSRKVDVVVICTSRSVGAVEK